MVLKCMKVSSGDQIPIHKNKYFLTKVDKFPNYYLEYLMKMCTILSLC